MPGDEDPPTGTGEGYRTTADGRTTADDRRTADGRTTGTRRSILAAAAGAVGAAAGLSGCVGVFGGGEGGGDGGTTATTTTPAGPPVEGEWTSEMHDAGNTGRATASGPATEASVRWETSVENDLGNGSSSPVVVDGTLYVGDGRGVVHALDAATGEEVWTYETGKWIHSTPAVHEGRVFVGSDDFTLYTLSAAEGEELWTGRFDFEVSNSPVVAGDTVLVGSTGREFRALEAADGSVRWTHTAEEAEDPLASGYGDAVTDGEAVYVGHGGRLLSLAADDGSVRWRRSIPGDFPRPTLAGGTLYAAADDELHALDPATGETRWTTEHGAGTPVSLAVGDDALYVAGYEGMGDDTGDAVAAVPADGGERRWRVGLEGGPSGLAVDGAAVYVNAASLVALSAETGERRWSIPTEDARGTGVAVVENHVFEKSLDVVRGIRGSSG